MQVSDERAELGTGALIIFIAIVLAAAIISVTMVATTESMFTKQNNDAATSSDAFSGIVTIVRLEVAVLAATDELHLTFEMPYIKTALPEDDISWTVFCPVETDGTDPEADDILFDSGDFTLATTLSGDGNTAGQISLLNPGADYHMRLSLTECDLDTLESATLILMVDNGKTAIREMNLSNAHVGMDVN